ncbi:Crp/Fnr family transcriptional regulator [Variovorax sp. OV329]|uniref:Crp/Fnr family transcriptional regulator n=1 Tax=Variovorax sp. OV329 TaxID=1882825 RepID=UPI0008EB68CD|nr:cyclic nucleotide-binding domain-containing protein [Variovorax sp. OV329]SFN38952.1 Cyclic nucleotide-binding domain-containing protein [Variovorax sp. OV329]
MDPLLILAAALPECRLSAGEAVVREGESGSGLWILSSGALKVVKAGTEINTITRPGAAVGEISLLLDAPYSATVVASEPTVLRYAADGRAFLASDPRITQLIAVGLAERLHFVTTYLADLVRQYRDASPGLAMVGEVLGQLAHHQRPAAWPGSVREPDPDY